MATGAHLMSTHIRLLIMSFSLFPLFKWQANNRTTATQAHTSRQSAVQTAATSAAEVPPTHYN